QIQLTWKGASYLDFGVLGFDRVLTFTDLDTGEVRFTFVPSGGVHERFFVPGFEYLDLEACLWGHGIVFCHAVDPESLEDAIVAYDNTTGHSDLLILRGRRLMRSSTGHS